MIPNDRSEEFRVAGAHVFRYLKVSFRDLLFKNEDSLGSYSANDE